VSTERLGEPISEGTKGDQVAPVTAARKSPPLN
jgi:hypothetical protein